MKYKSLLLILLLLGLSLPAYCVNTTEAKLEYNKGVDFYKNGQYDKSMAAFRRAIDLNPDYIDAYYNIGSILSYLGQEDAALTVFKQIIVRKPEDYESVLKAAELSYKLGYTDKAKDYLALIPQGSYVNQKAQELAGKMNTDLQTIKNERKVSETPTQPTESGIYENIASPTGMTTDKMGNLYVAGYSDNIVYKITPNGDRIVFLKDRHLNGPIGLISDDQNNIYIANYNANNVLKVDRTGMVSVLLSNVTKPYGLHISNGVLFVSSQGDNAIVRYKL